MRTGDLTTTTGIYRTDCGCEASLELRRGEVGPPCPRCASPTTLVFCYGTFKPPVAPEPIPSRLPPGAARTRDAR